MELTKEQANLIIQRLNSTVSNRQPCPICGNTHWTLNDRVFEIREFQGGSIVIGGNTSILPVIAISCTDCGFTHFINAIRLGVVDAQLNTDNKETEQNNKRDE